MDIIDDADGLSHITVGGVTLTLAGGEKTGPVTWLSADKQYQFILGVPDPDGKRNLYIRNAADTGVSVNLIVKDFHDGDLGFDLPQNSSTPPNPTPVVEIIGDRAPVDFDPDAGAEYRSSTPIWATSLPIPARPNRGKRIRCTGARS
ncbi:hypothetical protein [Methylocaldum szegediense]|uniref:hypothetical protein n=1 Tax=Methylocaldum szegediense TaxID=73780 RepID=UPI0004018E90|nr:hypothetical protein [Methylocaldum szegediense]